MALFADSRSLLEIELDRTRNQLAHLERSNKELKEAYAEDPDPEYRVAIGENILTIAKLRARVAALEAEIRKIMGEPSDVTSTTAVAVPVEDEQQTGSTSGAAPATQQGAGHTAAGSSTEAAAGSGGEQGSLQQQRGEVAVSGGAQPMQQDEPSSTAAPVDASTATTPEAVASGAVSGRMDVDTGSLQLQPGGSAGGDGMWL